MGPSINFQKFRRFGSGCLALALACAPVAPCRALLQRPCHSAAALAGQAEMSLVLLGVAALSGLPPKEVKLSCGVDHSKPCPVPTWAPTWDLARSTAIQPCNASGWYDPEYAAKWGLVSFGKPAPPTPGP